MGDWGFLAVRMGREAAARDWSAHHSLGRSPLVVPLSGVGRGHSASGDLVHLGWARSLLLSLAHLTKLVSFNWSQRPADLTPCGELLGSRRAARSRHLFSGYCCCCSFESVHSPLPSGNSPCCFLPPPRLLAFTPWAGLHLGGARVSIGGRYSRIETAAAIGLLLRSAKGGASAAAGRRCRRQGTRLSASCLSSASLTSGVSYFRRPTGVVLPYPHGWRSSLFPRTCRHSRARMRRMP